MRDCCDRIALAAACSRVVTVGNNGKVFETLIWIWPRLDRGLTPSMAVVRNWIPPSLLLNIGYTMSRAAPFRMGWHEWVGDRQNRLLIDRPMSGCPSRMRAQLDLLRRQTVRCGSGSLPRRRCKPLENKLDWEPSTSCAATSNPLDGSWIRGGTQPLDGRFIASC